MNAVPKTDAPLLSFAQVHAGLWASIPEGPGSVGLTVEEVEKYAGLYEEARAAYARAQAARKAAMDATAAMRGTLDRLRARSSDLVGIIKAFARAHSRAAENPKPEIATLAKAGLSVDAPAEGVRPPGTPARLSPRLESDGSIRLSWTATNASGSTGGAFIVQRRVYGRPDEFVTLDRVPGTSARSRTVTFVDRAVPMINPAEGTLGVVYRVVPVRRDVYGEASPSTVVMFGGRGGSGGSGTGAEAGSTIATGHHGLAVKRAAA